MTISVTPAPRPRGREPPTTRELPAVLAAYPDVGLELTETGRAAMAAHEESTAFRKHSYDLGTDQEIAYERSVFAPYQSYFGVESE